MTVNGTAEKASDQLPELPSGRSQAQNAQRASDSVTSPPASTAPRNSQSPKTAGSAGKAFGWLTSRDSLLDAHHPSLRVAWSEHRDAAARWEKTRAVRHALHAWGVFHLIVLGVIGVIGWVTKTFLRAAVATALIFALIYWR